MLQARTPGVVALLGLLAGTAMSAAASADERDYYRGSSGGQYWSQPQIRLGVDLLWGGYGYVPAPPPVVWHPSYYVPYRYYDEGHRHRHRHDGHRRHHGHDRWDDSDD